MSGKHTQTCWVARYLHGKPDEKGIYYSAFEIVAHGGEFLVAKGPNYTGDLRAENEANALVLAAAPDLLAAAKRALAIFKAEGESVRRGNVLAALDDAIKRAEGRV